MWQAKHSRCLCGFGPSTVLLLAGCSVGNMGILFCFYTRCMPHGLKTFRKAVVYLEFEMLSISRQQSTFPKVQRVSFSHSNLQKNKLCCMPRTCIISLLRKHVNDELQNN